MKQGLLRRPSLAASILAAGLLCFGANLWRNRYFFHDDTFISLRYADNLVRHGELVWNLGERVEGYTNFLHILLIAALGCFGMDLQMAPRVVNALAAVGMFIAVWRTAHIFAPGTDSAVSRAIGLALLVGSPSIAIWILGGLEGVPLAALAAAGHLPLVRLMAADEARPIRAAALAGTAFALAVLMRPDGALFALSGAVAVLFAAPIDRRQRLFAALTVAAIPAATASVQALWRLFYYGALLPNTFHAKAGLPIGMRLESGLDYLLEFAVQPPFWGVLVALALPAALSGPSRRPAVLVGMQIGVYVSYVVWAGGDHMVGSRLMVPILPLAALLVVAMLAHASAVRTKRVVPAFGIALPMLTVAAWPALPMDPAAFVGGLVGTHIARSWPKGELVALHTAGSTPYFATDLKYIDMLGLTDPVIARRTVTAAEVPGQRWPGHVKGDGAYVLQRRPRYIILGPAQGDASGRYWFLSDLELDRNPEFHRCYAKVTETIMYGDDVARRGPRRPRPLLFTYYRRTCD